MILTNATPKTISEALDARFQIQRNAAYITDHSEAVEIVIDLGSVATISTEELNGLIKFQSHARHNGCTLVLENVCEDLVKVFTVTRLDRLIAVRNPSTS